MNSSIKPYDIVIYGASGFTGKLVAEYMVKQYGNNDAERGAIRWAMAGRDVKKLASVKAEIGAPESVPLIAVDSGDETSLNAMVESTRVVLTTVGPYQLYGSTVVAACARSGTDYVDLCGEPAWMRQMIDSHEATAKASGARIIFSCGFDSIPFDLGVWFLQRAFTQKYGHPAKRVKGRVRKMKGTFSGGTAASLKATMAAAAADPAVLDLLRNPFSLTPGFEGPKQPHGMKPIFDESVQSWLAPFIMAPINTRNIHRSNHLQNHAWGKDFVYDEMVMTGPGEKGEATAMAMAADKSMGSKDGPKPGEGPSLAERDAGFYDLLFVAEGSDLGSADPERLSAIVKGDRDPGYGSTSKMITEAAICLLDNQLTCAAGIWTSSSALGEVLLERLEKNAGLSFELQM